MTRELSGDGTDRNSASPPLRPRVIKSVDLIGRALKLWLLGQLVLMAGGDCSLFRSVSERDPSGAGRAHARYVVGGLDRCRLSSDSLLRRLHYRSPALILLGIVVADPLVGIVGVILAAPITVVVYMAVKMADVEDPLE